MAPVEQPLGENYETIDAADLAITDLPYLTDFKVFNGVGDCIYVFIFGLNLL